VNKKYNEYDLSGEYGIGYCSNTHTEFYFDLEDYEKIKDYCWYERVDKKSGYCSVNSYDPTTGKKIKLHYLVMGKYVDHIDRNPFNNRKENLRFAAHIDNSKNRSKRSDNKSGVIGVRWFERTSKWVVRIIVNKKQKHIGYFENKEDAIRARLKAEKEYFGEFAPQRHLFEKYNI
jgi:hypothetical protein